MIYRLEQISRHPQRKYIIKALSGQTVYNGSVPKVFEANIEIDNTAIYIHDEDGCKTSIEANGNKIGEIAHDIVVTKKVLFLPIGYEYVRFAINGNNYEVFESGLGKNKHYFSIYNNGVVIGVIHKDDRVVNYLNKCTLYAENDDNMKNLIIYSMYLEATAFCDRSAGLGNTDVNIPYYSAQKELRDKYDPTFILKIKQMDGIVD